MKLGLVTSTALHAGLLAWGLVVLKAPPALETAAVEALPVDIVPIEEFTRAVKGSREAPKLDAPAPEPTLARPEREDAVNVGEAKKDTVAEAAPVTKPVPVEAAEPVTAPEPVREATEIDEAPSPSSRPEPASAPTTEVAATAEAPAPVMPEPATEPTVEPAPVPETEVASRPEPAELASDPVSEAIEMAEAAPEPALEAEPVGEAVETPEEPRFAALPASGPTARARPPRPRKAQTPERRNDPPTRTASRAEEGERSIRDEVKAVINREKASGGGAKRQTQKASLGTRRGSDAALSRSEMDALKQAIGRCWSPPAGVADAGSLVVKLRMVLDRTGALTGRPEIVSAPQGAGGRAAIGAATRAMIRCAPYTALPADKYDTWSEVVVNFDPREMF